MSKSIINKVLNLKAYILAVHLIIYNLPTLKPRYPYFIEVTKGVATEINKDLIK